MPKMIEITAAEYDRLQDCIREDGMRIAALIEENKALRQDAKRLTDAEVAPVVHGEWVKINKYDMESRLYCSYCKQEYDYIDGIYYIVSGSELPFYCPNCGAKMNGEGKRNETVQGV